MCWGKGCITYVAMMRAVAKSIPGRISWFYDETDRHAVGTTPEDFYKATAFYGKVNICK